MFVLVLLVRASVPRVTADSAEESLVGSGQVVCATMSRAVIAKVYMLTPSVLPLLFFLFCCSFFYGYS
jgi:hypothetical protein